MDSIDPTGIIPIFAGIYGILLAFRIIPKNPKDPEKMELWHRKFGKLMKIISPMLIGFGLLDFFRVI